MKQHTVESKKKRKASAPAPAPVVTSLQDQAAHTVVESMISSNPREFAKLVLASSGGHAVVQAIEGLLVRKPADDRFPDTTRALADDMGHTVRFVQYTDGSGLDEMVVGVLPVIKLPRWLGSLCLYLWDASYKGKPRVDPSFQATGDEWYEVSGEGAPVFQCEAVCEKHVELWLIGLDVDERVALWDELQLDWTDLECDEDAEEAEEAELDEEVEVGQPTKKKKRLLIDSDEEVSRTLLQEGVKETFERYLTDELPGALDSHTHSLFKGPGKRGRVGDASLFMRRPIVCLQHNTEEEL